MTPCRWRPRADRDLAGQGFHLRRSKGHHPSPPAHPINQALARKQPAGPCDYQTGAVVIGPAQRSCGGTGFAIESDRQVEQCVLLARDAGSWPPHRPRLTETPVLTAAQCGWNHGWRQERVVAAKNQQGFQETSCSRSIVLAACRAPLPHPASIWVVVSKVSRNQLVRSSSNALHRLNQSPSFVGEA